MTEKTVAIMPIIGVKAVADMFGNEFKQQSSVPKRLEEFKWLQKEKAMKNDPKGFLQVCWQNSGGYGKYKNKNEVKDSRGMTLRN